MHLLIEDKKKMKFGPSLALAIAAVASLALVAQQPATPAGSNTTSQPASAAKGSAIDYAHMRPVSVLLVGKLDSKSARVGEPVILKTTKEMRMADGTVLPKGSRLLGRVTGAQARDKNHDNGWIDLAFDQAVPKNGQTFAIHAIIRSVSLPASVQGEERTRGWGLMGPGPNGSSQAGTSAALADLAGGSGVGDTALTADANGGQIHPDFDETATGIPDVALTGDPTGATAGQLSASRKNFRLDAETQMVVGIVAAGK